MRLQAEELQQNNLSADFFPDRQKAQRELIEWTDEGGEDREEALLKEYLATEDPEELHRLAQVLLEVLGEEKKAEIPRTGSGFIGIDMNRAQGQQEAQILPKGAAIRAVIPGTPAEIAGLKPDDVITAIDEVDITGGDAVTNLMDIVRGKAPGTKLKLTVQRKEEVIFVTVTLMNREALRRGRHELGESRVDQKKRKELLKKDFFGWLAEERKQYRLSEQSESTAGKARRAK